MYSIPNASSQSDLGPAPSTASEVTALLTSINSSLPLQNNLLKKIIKHTNDMMFHDVVANTY